MSRRAEATGCTTSWLASGSRRTGVNGTKLSATRPASAKQAATPTAAPDEAAPTTAPATPGPIAWPSVGRTIPSNPLTAIRSDSSTSDGNQAE